MPNAPAFPADLSSSAIDVIAFSFYVLSIIGFLAVLINGLVLVQTQYALQSILQTSIMPAIIHRNPSRRQRTDAEWALNQHDVEATAVMRRARPFALCGPLPSTVTMIAIPVSLHFSGVGDLGFRVLLSMLLITIIHFANACTLHTYFNLIEQETRICFGSEVCSAQGEKRRSGNLFIYFTILFALSFVKTGEKGEDDDATKGWEPPSAYSALPLRIARLSQDFAEMEPSANDELERLV